MSKEKGKEYLEKFRSWSASMTDDDFLNIVYAPKGNLNRQEIKKLAGLSDQAIKKNAGVVSALKELEGELRERGILPPLTEAGEKARSGPKLYDKNARSVSMDLLRVAHLESDNHDLRVQIEALEKENEALRSKLSSSQETVEAIRDGLAVFTQCPS